MPSIRGSRIAPGQKFDFSLRFFFALPYMNFPFPFHVPCPLPFDLALPDRNLGFPPRLQTRNHGLTYIDVEKLPCIPGDSTGGVHGETTLHGELR